MSPNSSPNPRDFSFQTRQNNLKRLEEEEFDLLVVGGGITGAGVAWDASSRGLKVALIEKDDFAQGTSSRSSKLIHGGLRYLENKEFHLVFEALSERAFLMNSCPHLVRPLPFYMPIYKGDTHPAWLISAGMWLYDFLSLFRAPGLHQALSSGAVHRHMPFLKQKGLKCAFKYYDASMWDDALAIDVLVRAHERGACVVSRAKAVQALKNSQGEITRMMVADQWSDKIYDVRFKKLISCAGVWTDEVGKMLVKDLPKNDPNNQWNTWLAPSRGVHLVFDWNRIPVPGAVVMQHPKDGRISFVIPRHDFGPGITIVGTTDGPCHLPPDQIENEAEAIAEDQLYLLELLNEYFPDLKLGLTDIVNHYIGIRPLVDPARSAPHSGNASGKSGLQKVSREHTIDHGPGGSVIVAGGKYTTFRKMAEQIVDFALHDRPEWHGLRPDTDEPLFLPALPVSMQGIREHARARGYEIPDSIFDRYGADALEIYEINQKHCDHSVQDPEGFPLLEAQFRYAVRHQMVLSVDDFIHRRQPLALCRRDQGAPWRNTLQKALENELKSYIVHK